MSDETKTFWQYIFFSTNHLETHAICSIINKRYSNKRMAPNNKWKILTPLKFSIRNYSLAVPPELHVLHNVGCKSQDLLHLLRCECGTFGTPGQRTACAATQGIIYPQSSHSGYLSGLCGHSVACACLLSVDIDAVRDLFCWVTHSGIHVNYILYDCYNTLLH